MFIAENLHIISSKIKQALIDRDETFVRDLLTKISKENPEYIDLNVGPARGKFENILEWLTPIAVSVTNIPFSFDSTNSGEIEKGLKLVKNADKCIINSTSADDERLEKYTDLVQKYNTNLIALTMNKELGIPKEADTRLELAFEIIEKTTEKGIDNSKIFFDPLILPVSVDQTQAQEALNAIRMFKESFDPPVRTVVGLSNVSNGSPSKLKPLINRVFYVLAKGAGLDSAIVDCFDSELKRIDNMLNSQKPETSYDELLLNLCSMTRDMAELEDVSYDKNDAEQVKIYKTAEILLNKHIYSHSYL